VTTSNTPEVFVNIPAIPITELFPICNLVPFRITLYKFGRPVSIDDPMKFIVPPLAENVPSVVKSDNNEKLEVVVIVLAG
jgi:hypothetical protein